MGYYCLSEHTRNLQGCSNKGTGSHDHGTRCKELGSASSYWRWALSCSAAGSARSGGSSSLDCCRSGRGSRRCLGWNNSAALGNRSARKDLGGLGKSTVCTSRNLGWLRSCSNWLHSSRARAGDGLSRVAAGHALGAVNGLGQDDGASNLRARRLGVLASSGRVCLV